MMIKLANAVVTDVAMSSSLRSENHASLAEFESIQLVFVYIEVEYPLSFDMDVHISSVDLPLSVYIEVLYNQK